MNVTLTIKIPDNSDAEDSLWNDLQDEGMMHDLIAYPINREIWDYLGLDYGKRLHVEVEAALDKQHKNQGGN